MQGGLTAVRYECRDLVKDAGAQWGGGWGTNNERVLWVMEIHRGEFGCFAKKKTIRL